MRKYYIDNLRILCILLLFPFHTTMIFNSYGETFYVNGTPSKLLTFVNMGVYPWWMTGLFVLAGMSTMYALGHRTGKQFLSERVHKLLIPLLSCIVFVVPMQTYIADKFHNGYQGNYFEHLKVFLSITDVQGYDGHFTPAHTWFMLYLLIISAAVLPLLLWYQRKEKKLNADKLTMPVILLLGIPVILLEDVLNVGGKSFAQFGVCFLIGYFVLSEEKVQERLKKWCIPLGLAWIFIITARCIVYMLGLWESTFSLILYISLEWIGILAMIGLGKRFLDHQWKFTKIFVKAEFPLYLFHQTIIVMIGYWIVPLSMSVYVQYLIIMILSFLISYALYVICRKFALTRFLFGIKK